MRIPSEGSALSDTYTTVGPADAELTVERSRFLCRLRRVESEQAARAVVAEARAEHRQANHHCSAFVVGARGDLRRSSDDGEPAGTAGRPMLEVLAQHELSDVVAVVTRWFGGIKLGTGGLARAYSEAVGRALETAPRVQRRLMRACAVVVPHADAGRVEHVLRGAGVHVLDVTYAEHATLQVAVPSDEVEALTSTLATLRLRGDSLHAGELDWHDVT